MTKTVRVTLTHQDLNMLLEGKPIEQVANVGYGNMDVRVTLKPTDAAIKTRKNNVITPINKDK